MSVHEDVKKKLTAAFPGAEIIVQDTTAGHESHNDLTNLAVSVYWEGFEDTPLIEQHKKVHAVLAEELKNTIHALRLHTGVE